MKKYGMFFKDGKEIIHVTYQETLERAVDYFIEVKQMSAEDFKRVFIVVEMKKLKK
tara:strand:+ start:723 stop:890 length:168 start_codon:yes stop_codon:yes gene_type:complete